MALKLYNTLTRKKELFKSIKRGEVGMYSCGPTVYNYAHIGNLRTYIFNDFLKKFLQFLGYNVIHAMNLTDVDDKTIKGSQKEGMSLKDFTEKYTKIFFEDLHALNISDPTYIIKATDSIDYIVELVKILLEKGYAYKAEDGIYFSIEKSKGYGKLAQLEKITEKKERVKNDEYDKENAQDFALWKYWTKEDGNVYWETEIGKGRPGWHIECSAMSMKYLGESIDIHTGAVDLIFPHHTNEIAQSEAATGKKFVNYWLHGGFLNMGEKMSKSKGNVVYLSNLKEKGYNPLHYRYFVLSSHYRMPLIYNEEALTSAKNSYQRLKNIIKEFKDDGDINKKYLDDFKRVLEDDLNTPQALAVLWQLVRDENAKGKIKTIAEIDKVFGLNLLKKEKIDVPKEIEKLVKERQKAREEKNWKKSDELRDKIKEMGWNIKDVEDGWEVEKK
ncbi:MAG: cysteine--tRNA ligase [Candidatus Pacearchaeota archaeon]